MTEADALLFVVDDCAPIAEEPHWVYRAAGQVFPSARWPGLDPLGATAHTVNAKRRD
jgi:hypothetical protein